MPFYLEMSKNTTQQRDIIYIYINDLPDNLEFNHKIC